MSNPMSPLNWRAHHPKCAFCQWLKYDNLADRLNVSSSGYYECKVKERIIKRIYFPRIFCQCYKVKQVKELID